MNRINLIRNQFKSVDSTTNTKFKDYLKYSFFEQPAFNELFYPNQSPIKKRLDQLISEIYNTNNSSLSHQTNAKSVKQHQRPRQISQATKLELLMLEFGDLIANEPKNTREQFMGLQTLFECLAQRDFQLAMSFMHHMILLPEAILRLGSQSQRDIIKKIWKAEVFGSIALKELSANTNLSQIQTIAKYQKDLKQFVICTPNQNHETNLESFGISETSQYALIWANLHIGYINHGVHPFFVQIRDLKDNKLLPGVTISPFKTGQNQLDQLQFRGISFDSFVVPYESMLSKFAWIDKEGYYCSDNISAEERDSIFNTQSDLAKLCNSYLSIMILKSSLWGLTHQILDMGMNKPLELQEPSIKEKFNTVYETLSDIVIMNFSYHELKNSIKCTVTNNSQDFISNDHEFMLDYLQFRSFLTTQDSLEKCKDIIKNITDPEIVKSCEIIELALEQNMFLLYDDINLEHLKLRMAKYLVQLIMNKKGQKTRKALQQQKQQQMQQQQKHTEQAYFIELKVLQFDKVSDNRRSLFEKSDYDMQKALENHASNLLHQSIRKLVDDRKGNNVIQAFNEGLVKYFNEATLAYGRINLINLYQKYVEQIYDIPLKDSIISLHEVFVMKEFKQYALEDLQSTKYTNKKDMEEINKREKESYDFLRDEYVNIFISINYK